MNPRRCEAWTGGDAVRGNVLRWKDGEERGMTMTWKEAVHHRGEILIPRSVFHGISELSFSRKDRDEIR